MSVGKQKGLGGVLVRKWIPVLVWLWGRETLLTSKPGISEVFVGSQKDSLTTVT